MRFDDNGGAANYEPSSFASPTENPAYRERPRMIRGALDRQNRRDENEHASPAGAVQPRPQT